MISISIDGMILYYLVFNDPRYISISIDICAYCIHMYSFMYEYLSYMIYTYIYNYIIDTYMFVFVHVYKEMHGWFGKKILSLKSKYS